MPKGMKIMSSELLDSGCMQRLDEFWSADMDDSVRRSAAARQCVVLTESLHAYWAHQHIGCPTWSHWKNSSADCWDQYSHAWVRQTQAEGDTLALVYANTLTQGQSTVTAPSLHGDMNKQWTAGGSKGTDAKSSPCMVSAQSWGSTILIS